MKPSDAGTYVCQAQNALGTAQKQVELIVNTGTVAPGAPQVRVEEAELTLEAGHTATLHCSATGGVGWEPTERQIRAAPAWGLTASLIPEISPEPVPGGTGHLEPFPIIPYTRLVPGTT